MRSSNRCDADAPARARLTTRTVTARTCARRLSAASHSTSTPSSLTIDLRGEMMFHNPLRRWSAALAATTALTVCAAAQAFTPPPFPRIGGIQIGGPFNYNDSNYQSLLAKQSVMILNYWPGMAPGGEPMDSVVKAIKALNPNALVFLYTDSDEQFTDPTGSADASLRSKLNAMKWWLYSNSSYTSAVSSFYGDGGETINNSPYTPKDSSGMTSIDWISHWFVSNYY